MYITLNMEAVSLKILGVISHLSITNSIPYVGTNTASSSIDIRNSRIKLFHTIIYKHYLIATIPESEYI